MKTHRKLKDKITCMPHFRTTDFLNLRRSPLIGDNVLAVLPPETSVEQSDQETNGWMKVNVLLKGQPVSGFVAVRYLQADDGNGSSDVDVPVKFPEVHMRPKNRIISHNDSDGRAFPLNEQALPVMKLADIADREERRHKIHRALTFLDVEHSERYAPASGLTYCNIYAHDVSYCLGMYLPRVWWTSTALLKMQNGENVTPRYDVSIQEMSANRIADWFEDFGPSFGWNRIFPVEELQERVNEGKLGIAIAQRWNVNNPGHVSAVVPETATHTAQRHAGVVISPVQSQAGGRNRQYYSGVNWWLDQRRFRKFAFYVSP
jgi:hypothetical protein